MTSRTLGGRLARRRLENRTINIVDEHRTFLRRRRAGSVLVQPKMVRQDDMVGEVPPTPASTFFRAVTSKDCGCAPNCAREKFPGTISWIIEDDAGASTFGGPRSNYKEIRNVVNMYKVNFWIGALLREPTGKRRVGIARWGANRKAERTRFCRTCPGCGANARH